MVWGVDLILYYFTKGRYGEHWEGASSIVQLAGFVLMTTGVFIYYKVIDLPFECLRSSTAGAGRMGPGNDSYDYESLGDEQGGSSAYRGRENSDWPEPELTDSNYYDAYDAGDG